MGDQLEHFIMDNRDNFNDEEPSQQVWQQIDGKLKRKSNRLAVVWKVAAMLFLISTIVLIVDRSANDAPALLSQEVRDAESYYITLINEKKDAVIQRMSPEEQAAFLSELDQLDAMYLNLKSTYTSNTTNEQVVQAMIVNLQLRIEILDKQLEILEKFSTKEQNLKNEDIHI